MFTQWLNTWLISWGASATASLWYSLLIAIAITLCVAYVAHFILKHYLILTLKRRFKERSQHVLNALIEGKFPQRLAHLAPGVIIYAIVPILKTPGLDINTGIIHAVQAVMLLYIIAAVVLMGNSILFAIDHAYRYRSGSKRKSIKSYLQVARIALYFVAIILGVSIIMGKSPLVLLTGLGAMAAILMLVFKDSILGFVASVQLSSYDMVRVGDWVVLPQYHADGDVMEISLNTVKIQNFDKTITTVPTSALLTTGVTNWRGMQESGGRRIKRSIHIDMNTVGFCDETLLKKLSKLHNLSDYIKTKVAEIKSFNQDNGIDKAASIANGRHLTNVGLFRAYIESYVKAHPQIHDQMTLLVRQLQPTETGLPLEIYIFTNDTNWNRYEAIQADIFDHLLAALPEFNLAVFQNTSGQNLTIDLIQAEKEVKDVQAQKNALDAEVYLD